MFTIMKGPEFNGFKHKQANSYIAVLLLIAVFSSLSTAQEVYKWTDADGNIHYGDRPPSQAENATPVDIPPVPTDAQRQQAQALQQQQSELADSYKAKREAQKAAKAQQELENKSAGDLTAETPDTKDDESSSIYIPYCRGRLNKGRPCHRKPPKNQPILPPKKPIPARPVPRQQPPTQVMRK